MKLTSAAAWDHPAHCSLCPLSQAKVGAEVRVKQLAGAPEIAHRLRELGIREEQVVKLLTAHTTVICLVCQVRLALSGAIADTILVAAV